jgi:hypothetical protein
MSPSPVPTRGRTLPLRFLIGAALLLWFALAALATPFDHDESQYAAGAWLAGRMTIFRDFLYLQPPLHAWAYAPLTVLFPDHAMLAMRLVTAGTALATLLVLWKAQSVAGISRVSATIATLLIATTASFQFTAGVVRNDMLPTLLSSVAVLIALRELDGGRRVGWFVTGLLMGLAIATKLSFAPLGLTVGLFLLARGKRSDLNAALWLAVGAVAGMVPMLIAWAAAPDAFLYGVFTYGMTAPHAWYAINGAGGELTLAGKAGAFLNALVKGPALVALLTIAVGGFATRKRSQPASRRLAIWLTAGALVGAALPTPFQLQYLMPVLPPLALSLGYLLDDARRWTPARRHLLHAILGISVIPGMIEPLSNMAALVSRGSPVLRAEANARWAGDLVRQEVGQGSIATLSPHLMLASGLAIDPRFAAGPFAYRTGWTVPASFARRLHMMTPQILADMDRAPPAAILTGYEAGTRNLPLAPDDGLIAYAQKRHYRPMPMPDGGGMLYQRPANVRRLQPH